MLVAWSADPFQTLGHGHQIQAAGDGGRILHHVAGQLAVELAVQGVHLLVARDDGAGLFGILVDKGIQGLP